MKSLFFYTTIAVLVLTSCNVEESISSSDSVFSLTDEEQLFVTAKTSNHTINEYQALQIANQFNLSHSTRSNNNSGLLTPITKAQLGISDNTEYRQLSDTIIYLYNEENGYCSLIAADNRIGQKHLGQIKRDLLFPKSNENVSLELCDFIRESLLQTIKDKIERYESVKDSMNHEIARKINIFLNGQNTANITTRANADPEIGFDPDDYDVDVLDVVLSPWQEDLSIEPLLPVAWGQLYPYNDYVRDTIQCNNYYGVPTGCAATAVAMLMAYWNYPATLNGLYLDWSDITAYDYPYSSSAKHQVRTIMKTIGVECNATYGCDGTSINVNTAKNWLLSHGYTCGDRVNYNFTDVISCLTAEEPVFITGKTVSGTGHGWIIDGAIVEKRTVHRYYVYTNMITGDSFTIDGGIIVDYSRYFNNNYGDGNAISWLASDLYTYIGSSYPIEVKIFKHLRPSLQ